MVDQTSWQNTCQSQTPSPPTPSYPVNNPTPHGTNGRYSNRTDTRNDPSRRTVEGGVQQRDNWLRLDGSVEAGINLGPGGTIDFGRSAGLNVETGELRIGNLQLESPLERKLEFQPLDWPGVAYGKALARNPIIMELERLARASIGNLELIDVENDGYAKYRTQRDIDAFAEWQAKYQDAVRQSQHGKPRIEKFYRDNLPGAPIWYPRASEMRVLFGNRIHSLLRPGR